MTCKCPHIDSDKRVFLTQNFLYDKFNVEFWQTNHHPVSYNSHQAAQGAEEGLAEVEQPGWDEGHHVQELKRDQGWLNRQKVYLTKNY